MGANTVIAVNPNTDIKIQYEITREPILGESPKPEPEEQEQGFGSAISFLQASRSTSRNGFIAENRL